MQPDVCAILGKAVFHLETAPQHCTGRIYYFATDIVKPNAIWKWLWIDPVGFYPKKNPENLQAKKAHPANLNLRRTSWWPDRQSFSTELRDWANLQMQLCLSVVSPRGSTHHLYGSAPTKLYYIRLQRSSPPFLSGLTLLLSEQHSADTEQPERRKCFSPKHFRTHT